MHSVHCTHALIGLEYTPVCVVSSYSVRPSIRDRRDDDLVGYSLGAWSTVGGLSSTPHCLPTRASVHRGEPTRRRRARAGDGGARDVGARDGQGERS